MNMKPTIKQVKDRSLAGNSSLRVFIAIRLSESLKDMLLSWRLKHEQELPFRKWTHRDDYHITLQFLGDVSPERIPAISRLLSRVGAEVKPFSLKLGELGTFGLTEAPRVLWAGVEGDLNPLLQLQRLVTEAMSELGFVPEKRAYRPHITIARQYKGENPFPGVGRMLPLSKSDFHGESQHNAIWNVNEFVLFATNLQERPMYEILDAVRLEN